MRKATGVHTAYVYWCALDERAVEGQFIEVPKWMLDLATCAPMRLGDIAWVDLAALRAAQDLLQASQSKSAEEIGQAQSSSQGETDEQPPIVELCQPVDVVPHRNERADVGSVASTGARRIDAVTGKSAGRRGQRPPGFRHVLGGGE